MAKRKNFAIIGTSNFSLAVIDTLVQKRQKVTVFDNDSERMELYLSEYDSVDKVVLDATNKLALQKNGIKTFDGVVVGFGTNMEASLMTVLNLKDLEVENIAARARDDKHRRILNAIGLLDSQIINPDSIAGKTIGTRLVFGIDVDIDMQTNSDDFVSTILIVKNPAVYDKSLDELNLNASRDLNIIQIKRNGKVFLPDESTVLKENDNVTVFARSTIINDLVTKIQGTPIIADNPTTGNPEIAPNEAPKDAIDAAEKTAEMTFSTKDKK